MASSAVDTVTDPLALARAERAKRAAAKAEVMAAADMAYTAWYQDLGTRAEAATQGHAGVHRLKVLATAPKCWCGKATCALGMCENHYSQWWRAVHGQRAVARNQRSLCHPDRSHHAWGLCRKCYECTPIVRRQKRVAKVRARYLSPSRHPTQRWNPGGLLASACQHTNKRAKARGLCAACYKHHHDRGTVQQFPRVRSPDRRYCRSHPDRPVHARGMCQLCYLAWWKKRKVTKQGRQQRFRLPGMPLACGHDDQPHAARDLCIRCYHRWYNAGPRRVRRNRTRMPRGAKIILCGHPERPYYARCCCGPCYTRKVFHDPLFIRRFVEAFGHAVAQQRLTAVLHTPHDVRPNDKMLDSMAV